MKNNWWRGLFFFFSVFQSSYEDTMISKKSYACVNFIQTKFQKLKIKFYYFIIKKDVWIGCEVHLIYLPWNFLKVWVKNHIDAPKSILAQFVLRVTLRPTQWWEGPRCIQEAQVGVPWFCPTSRTFLDPTPTPTQGYGIHTPPMQKGFKE